MKRTLAKKSRRKLYSDTSHHPNTSSSLSATNEQGAWSRWNEFGFCRNWIYKIEDYLCCNNQRKISLLCTSFKIVMKIIERKCSLSKLSEPISKSDNPKLTRYLQLNRYCNQCWECSIGCNLSIGGFLSNLRYCNDFYYMFFKPVPPKLVRLIKTTMDNTQY